MEIIFKSTKRKSNFTYCSELFKDKNPKNGFNKLGYCPVGNSITECENVLFEKELTGKLYLCYPLSVVIEEEIKYDSLHSLIEEIRRVYKEIYKDYNSVIKFGVWGHTIYDLVIESITVYDDNSVEVSIGS